MTFPLDLGGADTPRWVQRRVHFGRALALLREGVETAFEPGADPMLLEGFIQRCEYTWELAWKTLKDFLDHEGVRIARTTPPDVIRTAFSAGIIIDGQGWMDALDARNLMSHTYNAQTFAKVAADVRDVYLQLFEDLDDVFLNALTKTMNG